MGIYLLRRLLLAIPTILLVTIIVFFFIRLIPGSIVDEMMIEHKVISDTAALRSQIETELGLNVPIPVQYGRWINGIIHGDLGKSLWNDRPVVQEITNRLPISLELGFLALVTSLVISIPIGIYSAIRQDTIGDYVARSFAIACIALPSFWLGTLVMVFPSIWWDWSPSMQYIPLTQDVGGNLLMFIVPAVILGMTMSGTTMRMTRTMMLEVLRQDYVRTAWAKGLRERVVVVRHALRNALIPVVTIIGLQLPVLIGGSVVLERIFNLPGIGWLLIDVINSRDYTVLSGVNFVLASFVLIINLAVDLTYSYLDPRVQYR
jgi:peptide/nickel transport system permease protein